MERLTKIVLSIVFPGIVGFLTACVLILPQMILRGLEFPLSLGVGVMLSGIFSAFFAVVLRNRIRVVDSPLDAGQPVPVRAE